LPQGRPVHEQLPSLARTARELIAANGATSTIENLGTLLGPLAAGVLVAFADVDAVFAASAAALAAAVVLLARVATPGRIDAAAAGSRSGVLQGFRAIAAVPGARLLVGLIGAQTFVRGCLNVLIVVAAYQVLQAGATEIGYLTAAIGAGGLVGALAAVSLRGERLAPVFCWALVAWGVPIMLMAPLRYTAAIAILLAVIGAANSFVDVSGFTLLQRTVPDDVLARVLGVTWSIAMGGTALGSCVTPGLIGLIGLRPAFVAVGAVLPVLVLVSGPRVRRLDASVARASQLDLIERVAIFAPLSLVAKERIAAHVVPVDVAAGEVVIQARDPGERLYIIAPGELAIDAGSQTVEAGPGDFFGVIALLRDVPRTATVRAVTDARLYALERGDFLAVMTGNERARSRADAEADRRLDENAAAAQRLADA
jgi:hypothetical protein